MSNQNRVPKGVPTGGQWAEGRHGESSIVSLSAQHGQVFTNEGPTTGAEVLGSYTLPMTGWRKPEDADNLYFLGFARANSDSPDIVGRLTEANRRVFPGARDADVLMASDDMYASCDPRVSEYEREQARQRVDAFIDDNLAQRGLGRRDFDPAEDCEPGNTAGNIFLAQSEGYIPDCSYTVAGDLVAVSSVSDEDVFEPQPYPGAPRTYTPEARELCDRLTRLGGEQTHVQFLTDSERRMRVPLHG